MINATLARPILVNTNLHAPGRIIRWEHNCNFPNTQSNLMINKSGSYLSFNPTDTSTYIPYIMLIIADDKKYGDGDWKYNTVLNAAWIIDNPRFNFIGKIISGEAWKYLPVYHNRRIIASDDESMGLPEIPSEFREYVVRNNYKHFPGKILVKEYDNYIEITKPFVC